MNKRFKALALKAGCRARKFTCGVSMYPNVDQDLQKFAELIVKECSAYVEGTGNWLVAMEMKQYFGVEE